MNWLLSADLHLSDRARDSYRFGLFPWLKKQQQKNKVDATFLLGDLTQEKDRHSSALVNRIVEELLTLTPPVYVLRGNHDGLNPNSPFFKFLNSISGLKLRPGHVAKKLIEPCGNNFVRCVNWGTSWFDNDGHVGLFAALMNWSNSTTRSPMDGISQCAFKASSCCPSLLKQTMMGC